MAVIVKHIKKGLIAGALICTNFVYANVEQTNQNINSNKIALVGGTIVSPHLSNPINDATVLIENGVITAISPAVIPIDKQYQKVDVTNQWLLPGFIDSHVHFFESASAFTRPDIMDLREINAYEQDRQWTNDHLLETFAQYLSNGITSVIDMGGPYWNFSVRQKANNHIISPRVTTAGPLISPVSVPVLDVEGTIFEKVTDSPSAIKAVAEQLKYQPDLIKIAWLPDAGHSPVKLSAMFKGAIELAHQHDLPVAVHVQGLANAKQAIKAGADILVHGVLLEAIDDEFVQLIKSSGVIYMPTLAAHKNYIDIFEDNLEFSAHELNHIRPYVKESFAQISPNMAKAGMMFKMVRKYIKYVHYSDEQIAKMPAQEQAIIRQLKKMFSPQVTQVQKENLNRMYEEGITLALGTDAGNAATIHGGSLLSEMLAWREAGIPMNAIIEAASLNGAKVTNQDRFVGSIEVGKLADLVILDKNPLASVHNLSAINKVIKHGNIISVEVINQHIKQLNH